MHARWFLTFAAAVWLATPQAASTAGARLNPMIALHEQGMRVFGVTHAAIAPPRQRPAPPGAAPVEPTPALPLPSLMAAAAETAAYRGADFTYTSYASPQADRFMGFVGALMRAGASVRTHPILAKVPIIHTDPPGDTTVTPGTTVALVVSRGTGQRQITVTFTQAYIHNNNNN